MEGNKRRAISEGMARELISKERMLAYRDLNGMNKRKFPDLLRNLASLWQESGDQGVDAEERLVMR